MDTNPIRQPVDAIRHGLVVSCQAHGEHPLRDPLAMVAMAECAERGGAVGIRADGPDDIAEIANSVALPVIGIHKEPLSEDRFFITPTFEHAREIVAAGADVVALEATFENRPDAEELGELVRRIRDELGAPVMADVSTFEEGTRAWGLGADLVATTLSGYTRASADRQKPDLDLVGELAGAGMRAVCEGNVWTPAQVAAAFEKGAYSVVVGTAITDPVVLTSRFAYAAGRRRARERGVTVSYLCVDGGQTKTAIYLLDRDGKTVESWEEGPLTTPSKPGAFDDLRRVVRRSCEELERRLTRLSVEPPEAACFSLSGYLERADGVPPAAGEGRASAPTLVEETVGEFFPKMARVHTIPDYVGNWAAATRGEPGIMVLSGGGTVAYGRDASGNSLRIGGWGHLLGDEGSGYWIGLEAIKAALRSWAGTAPKTDLEEALTTKFRVEEDRQLIEKVYSGNVPDAEIAGLVPLVDSHARQGDEVAMGILDAAAAHLVGMGAAMLAGLGELDVHLSGGVFRAAGMEERFGRLLREAGHGARVFPRSAEPSEGIFLIAKGGVL